MRRLPVYFLVDVSDSMAGEPIRAVQNGIKSILADLRNDPYALETMHLGVLVFAGKAEICANLEELPMFQPPTLPVGAGTSLGAGLRLLMSSIDTDVRKTTVERKGDWKPLVFLFTDGCPTDDASSAIARWNQDYRRRANMVIVTFGANADMELLRSLCDDVLTLSETTPASFREFFRWVSASLQVSSMAVNDSHGDGIHLAGHCINLDKAPRMGITRDQWAVLRLKCASNGQFWLARYARSPKGWSYVESCPVDEAAYTRLAADTGIATPIDFADVDSTPRCPICGSREGVIRCGRCGGLFCISSPRAEHCPWCDQLLGPVREVDSMQTTRSFG